MARNGSGTYSRVKGPYVYNTVIDQVEVNAELDDIASALTASLAKDGQTTLTADLPMGGFKLSGLTAGTVAGDSVRYEQVGAVATIQIHAATSKTTPVDADELAIVDSEAANVLKKLTWANLKSVLLGFIGLTAGKAQQVDQAVATTTRAATTDFTGESLEGTLSNTGVDITAFHGVAGITYTRKCLGAGNITAGAGLTILQGGATITTAAGDTFEVYMLTATTCEVRNYQRAVIDNGARQLQSVSASVASSALTIGALPLTLEFRSTTAGNGTYSTVTGAPANLVISSGSTLGTVDAVQSRIAILAINNAGTIELAAVNMAGGVNLDETGIISTTAEGGAGAADSASVVYSTTARTNVAYRVIGYVESTQATAGTWATAPSKVQPAGGNAMTSMGSFGYGQTRQDVAASRANATTYYNTTGKVISVSASMISTAATKIITATIGGLLHYGSVAPSAGNASSIKFEVLPSESYSVTIPNFSSIFSWVEVR